jgi:ribosome recycling factor
MMNIATYDQQMQKALTYLEKEFQGLQVGRATTSLVENINVETEYGTMKLNGIALILLYLRAEGKSYATVLR